MLLIKDGIISRYKGPGAAGGLSCDGVGAGKETKKQPLLNADTAVKDIGPVVNWANVSDDARVRH